MRVHRLGGLVVVLSLLGTQLGTVMLAGPSSADSAWFVDSVSPADRAREIPVPDVPARYDGKRRHTVATMRTDSGSLAVPVAQAFGHRLEAGQALSLSRGGYFAFDSAKPRKSAKRQVRGLADALTNVTSVTCEGYADYAGSRESKKRLSKSRARAICRLVAQAAPHVATDIAAYGGSRPAVVGGDRGSRAQNRRVVIAVTGATAAPVPAPAPAPPPPPVESQNHAPVAQPDSYATNEDSPIVLNPLTNDTDADNDKLVAAISASPSHGQLVSNSDGTFTYVPNSGYYGVDTFTYRASDGSAASDPATVTINVNSIKHQPIALQDSLVSKVCELASGNVLYNDTSPDGQELTVVNPRTEKGAYGTLTLNEDGSWSYLDRPKTLPAGESVQDTFKYTAANPGGNTSSSTLTITTVSCSSA